MFDYKRTPFLALLFAGLLTFALVWFFELPERPFTRVQLVVLYVLCFLPSLGFAMMFDPRPRRMKAEYLKINFYAPKEKK